MYSFYIKVVSLSILFIGSLIASLTDIKNRIIPNSLSLLMLIIGVVLATVYYHNSILALVSYYISIICVYVFSYILWYFGVWAGGDVKLFTAISTLFTVDYLDILPVFNIHGISLPYFYHGYFIATFTLILNSIFSVFPIILIFVLFNILKNKTYLIKTLVTKDDIINSFFILNTLELCGMIIDNLYMDNVLINMVFLIFGLFLINKLFNRFKLLKYILCILVILIILINNNYYSYIIKFLSLIVLMLIKHLIRKNLIKDSLTNNISINNLQEGMVLNDNLLLINGEYIFKSNSIADYYKPKSNDLIIKTNSGGLDDDEIKLLKQLYESDLINSTVKIKKTIPFVPFIFVGLIVSLSVGDLFLLFKKILMVIL